jgi:hypothetical protein
LDHLPTTEANDESDLAGRCDARAGGHTASPCQNPLVIIGGFFRTSARAPRDRQAPWAAIRTTDERMAWLLVGATMIGRGDVRLARIAPGRVLSWSPHGPLDRR